MADQPEHLSFAQLFGGGFQILRENPAATIIGTVFYTAFDLTPFLLSMGQLGFDWELATIHFVLYGAIGVPLTEMMMDARGGADTNARHPLIGLILATIALLVANIGVSLGMIFFLIPGIYIAARWYLVVPLVLSGRVEWQDSFGRSWEATEESFRGLMVLTVILFVVPPIGSLIETPAEVAVTIWDYLAATASSLILAGTTLFGLGVAIFAHRELFNRNEMLGEIFS